MVGTQLLPKKGSIQWLNFGADYKITALAQDAPTNFSELLSHSSASTPPKPDSPAKSVHQSEGDLRSRTFIMFPAS